MKRTLQLVLLIALAGNAVGQDYYESTVAFCESPVNIALDEEQKVFVAPPQRYDEMKSAKMSSSTFTVTFHNFPEEAKQAFYYAVSIWEELISSPVQIHIEARWEKLSGNILAKGNPSIFYNNFSGAPFRNVYYPVALAEKLNGRDMNAGAPDIVCKFSSSHNWYFGTDGNTPVTHYDLVSSALHEITHGLGFSGFLNEKEGKGYFNNSNELPSIYDYFLFNNQNQQISNKSLFQSPSAELYKQITSNNVKFCQATSSDQDQKMIDWIFAPSVWNDGTSIYHLKGYNYGEENGLMSPYAVKGKAIHNPGKITMEILAQLGWKNINFEFYPLKDIERSVDEWPFQVKLKSDNDEATQVRVIYSFDEFSTAKSVSLHENENTDSFLGNLALNSNTGTLKYYIEATTPDNRTYRHPQGAPSKTFSMNIGPDIFAPELYHNPVSLLSCNTNELELQAEVSDNIGIKSIKVDYKINDILQEPVFLTPNTGDIYSVRLNFPGYLKNNDVLEYRITAEDLSAIGNKNSYPATGFQKVKVFNPIEPVNSYSTNFETGLEDFFTAGFMVSAINGYSGNILQTCSPYQVSAMKNEKYSLVAQLKYPVIIQQGGKLKFKETVLVEPGSKPGTDNDSELWDYVVVEASKDGGLTWLPLSEKYNSGSNDNWYSAFTKSFSHNSSTALPHESLFVNHFIDLTQNTGLEPGDTAIFRFRLASDNSVNGFGWAIDDLEIQEFRNDDEKLFAEGSFLLYPNPAKNQLYIECSQQDEFSRLEVVITNMLGKVIRRQNDIEPFYSPKIEIDLSDINPGIYMVSINQGTEILSTNKIIKN